MNTNLSEKLWDATDGGLRIYEDLFEKFQKPKKAFSLDQGSKNCIVFPSKENENVYLVKDHGSCSYSKIENCTNAIGAYADMRCGGDTQVAFWELYERYVGQIQQVTSKYMPKSFNIHEYLKDKDSELIRIGISKQINSAGREWEKPTRFFILQPLKIVHCRRLIPSLLKLVSSQTEFEEKILRPLEKVQNIKIWKVAEFYQHTKNGLLKKDGEHTPMFFFENKQMGWEFYYQPTADKQYKWLWNRKEIDTPVFWDFADINFCDSEKNYDKKNVFICSGLKDALNMFLHGYRAVGLQSETNLNALPAIFNLYSQADFVAIMDADKTGRQTTRNIVLNYRHVGFIDLSNKNLIPEKGVKDVSDAFARCTDIYGILRFVQRCEVFRNELVRNKNGQVVDEELVYHNIEMTSLIELFQYYRYRNTKDELEPLFLGREQGYFLEKTQLPIVHAHMRNEIIIYEKCPFVLELFDRKVPNLTRLEQTIKIKDAPTVLKQKDTTRLYFSNCVIDITKDRIQEVKDPPVFFKELSVNYNKKQFFDFDKSKLKENALKPPFTLTKDKDEKWSVQFHQLDSYDILKFIICTCRMYWEKEADILKEEGKTEEEILQYFRDNVTLTSPLLSKEDQQSQVQHFANKIWILGYLMHPHNRTTDRGVWITEFKNTLYKDKSYGGTGKTTLFHKMLEMVTPTFETGSKDPNEKTEFKMTEFQDGVHAYICFGETPAAVYFSRFYKSFVDGRGIINEKKGKYAAQKEPTKVSILSNHMPLDIDEPTTYRRLIFGFMSDFFHSNMDKEDYESYESDVTGQIFFEKELFDDWTPKEWQKQWELMIAIQMFYFNHTTPIQVLDKVREKAKNSVITDADIDFFNGYIFANKIMVLSELYDTYREAFKSKTSAAMITKKLKAWAASGNVTTKDGEPEKGYYNHDIWCQWEGIKLDSKGRIQKWDDGKVVKMFVIVTESALQEMQREREKQANQGDTPNEAPF